MRVGGLAFWEGVDCSYPIRELFIAVNNVTRLFMAVSFTYDSDLLLS